MLTPANDVAPASSLNAAAMALNQAFMLIERMNMKSRNMLERASGSLFLGLP